MREILTGWVGKTFGDIHAQDIFNLKEEVQQDKSGNRIRFITLYLKKYQGLKKNWAEAETFATWASELKELVGSDILKLDIRAAEAKEQRYVGGIVIDAHQDRKYIEKKSCIFNYQINIQILIPMEHKT